jgi:hypothetical protein
VRLTPAQYVKPYIKTNKSDYIDADAIAEAVKNSSCLRENFLRTTTSPLGSSPTR